jgi:hypothetical protein
VTNPFTEASPSTRGRILAGLYLVVITGGIIAQGFIADRLIVPGDASRTAANITGNLSLYRLGFTIFMIEMVAQVAVTALFYDLLKPVNRSVARLSMIIGLTGCGIKALARLFYYAPLILLGEGPYAAAFPPAELEALSLAFIGINSQGAAMGLIFFGFETLLHGWLVFKSGFLPRILGMLSMIAGIGWLTWLWPPLGAQAFMPVALFAILGSVGMIGWLLIRGVDDVKWRERAALASASIYR